MTVVTHAMLPSEVDALSLRLRRQLPAGQARVAEALLVTGPEFEPPERPVTYTNIAEAFNLRLPTVREHLRRIARGHPDLYAELMAERERRFERWHTAVSARRLERSRRWGKRRWAARYRDERGHWPWEDLGAAPNR